MPEPIERHHALNDRERDDYVNCLTRNAVPSRQRPFYVMRVKQYLVAMNGRDPNSLNERHIGAS